MEERSTALRHNLPPARTSFVGREREVKEIQCVLATTRLLTLTGVGGSGKTRLALEVARDLAEAYPDGVRLVELAPLREEVLVPQAVAAAAGVREQPYRSLTDMLVDAFSEQKVLLVLDNCEHLVEAVAQLVDTLVDSCGNLRILATSREALRVGGEINWLVSPLSVPDPRRSLVGDDLSNSESVRLFVDRARYRKPAFTLTSHNAQDVAEICRRLEGIPLAIELAAVRVGTLSLEQIARRLEDSLKLLTAGSRTAPPKQRTLRGTLDWSYDLLLEPEQTLFGRLSVFAGGWTLEAAEAVGAGEGIERDEALDLLSGLVDKSLVIAEASGDGEARYRMLELVRKYGRKKLEASGEAETAKRRHAAFFLALAEEAEPELRGAQQGKWLKWLEAEHDNLRAALSWLLETGEVESGLRLSGALGAFWHMRGYLDEGRWWLEAALAKTDAPTSTRAKALTQVGWLAWEQGDYERSEASNEESLSLHRELGDQAGVAATLYSLGWAAFFQNQLERASKLAEEAIALQRELNDTVGLARTLLIPGMVAGVRHDYEQGLALHEESLALAREVGDSFAIVLSLGFGAMVFLDRNAHRRVRALLKEGLELSQQLKMTHQTAFLLRASAALASSQGQPVRSARLWGAAEAMHEAVSASRSPVELYYYGPYIAASRIGIDEATWETAWAEGRGMTLEEAVEYALLTEDPVEEEHTPSTLLVPQTGETLTAREVEVLRFLSSGASNKQIADELVISPFTVKRHVASIMRKLEAPSRTHAAARARHLGFV